MLPVMDQQALRVLIRQKLTDRSLPHNGIPKVWGGPGNGEICDACALVIERNQFVMEGASTDFSKQGVQFHVECFYVWDSERIVAGR
jgi:hypothetical protein